MFTLMKIMKNNELMALTVKFMAIECLCYLGITYNDQITTLSWILGILGLITGVIGLLVVIYGLWSYKDE